MRAGTTFWDPYRLQSAFIIANREMEGIGPFVVAHNLSLATNFGLYLAQNIKIYKPLYFVLPNKDGRDRKF